MMHEVTKCFFLGGQRLRLNCIDVNSNLFSRYRGIMKINIREMNCCDYMNIFE